jgi:hypothetical protein
MRDADEKPDTLTADVLAARIAGFTALEELARRRYVHRHTVNREPILMDAVVARVLR